MVGPTRQSNVSDLGEALQVQPRLIPLTVDVATPVYVEHAPLHVLIYLISNGNVPAVGNATVTVSLAAFGDASAVTRFTPSVWPVRLRR